MGGLIGVNDFKSNLLGGIEGEFEGLGLDGSIHLNLADLAISCEDTNSVGRTAVKGGKVAFDVGGGTLELEGDLAAGAGEEDFP